MLLLSSDLAISATPAIIGNDARQIGIEAYVYVEAGKKPGLGLAGAFQHFRKLPTAEFREVLRPNFDTLYSLAGFDVSKEPYLSTLCTARRPQKSAAPKHPNELPYP
jgi:hypothetical protein